MPGPLEPYRQQLARLLDLVDQQNLARVDRDALATGIRVARRTGKELELPRLEGEQLNAFKLGQRILYQLIEADAELAPAEVAELETVLDVRLPETL